MTNRFSHVEVYTKAVEYLKDLGFASSVIEDYSGPGMHGSRTTAIVTNAIGTKVGSAVGVALGSIMTEEGDFDMAEWENLLERYTPNSSGMMGHNIIYYNS